MAPEQQAFFFPGLSICFHRRRESDIWRSTNNILDKGNMRRGPVQIFVAVVLFGPLPLPPPCQLRTTSMAPVLSSLFVFLFPVGQACLSLEEGAPSADRKKSFMNRSGPLCTLQIAVDFYFDIPPQPGCHLPNSPWARIMTSYIRKFLWLIREFQQNMANPVSKQS